MQPTTLAKLTQAEKKKIVEFLQGHPVGVLATVGADGNPHASTIYFGVDDDLRVTFTTKHDTYKYENITRHDTVMLVVFEAESQSSVQISGHAVEVKTSEEQQAVYHDTLRAAKKTGEDVVPPIAKIPAGPYVGFTITIDKISLSEYGWGNNFANAMKHAHDPNTEGDPA
jgi:general stress protein 26